MPLYEYLCDACGHRFEVIQKFSDPPVEACPKCGGKVQKQVAAPAFQFKGSGWYITDYARKDAPKGSEGSKGTDAPGTDTAAKSAESKDAKPDAGATSEKTTTASEPASKPADKVEKRTKPETPAKSS
jgi:putative FmdB family regulatory protein